MRHATALAVVTLCLFLVGCGSPRRTVATVEEWGPAEASIAATRVRVEPLVLPDQVAGDLRTEDADWRRTWPEEGAAEVAAGIRRGAGRRYDVSVDDENADLVVQVAVRELDVGSGKSRYLTGASRGRGASLISGHTEIETVDGVLVVKLFVEAESFRGNLGLAFHNDCYNLGREVGIWLARQQR
jgi:hypothetical protein